MNEDNVVKDDVPEIVDETPTLKVPDIVQKAVGINKDDAYANSSWVGKLFLTWCTGVIFFFFFFVMIRD